MAVLRFPRPRRLRRRPRLGALGLGVLLLAVVWGVHAPVRSQVEAPPGTTLPEVFADIERAWTQGDAETIVARFGDHKVLLRLPGNSWAPRRFSHQQSILILRDHFSAHETRQFDFVRTQMPETPQGRALGLASVSWRPRGAGRTRQSRVLVVLERQADAWKLTRMLALP